MGCDDLTTAVEAAIDERRDGTGRERIDNVERGCGFLKANKAYIRSDVDALSHPDGDMPRFVGLDNPVEYREATGQGAIIPGYKRFPGTNFALAYDADGRTTTPDGDIGDHLSRLRDYGFGGSHFADMPSARSYDLLLSVGKSHWPDPDDYIVETRRRGLNLAIPTSQTQEPPVIRPLRTRAWVIHPHGAGENHPAIIGYAYLTRVVYTTGTNATADDPDVPGYVEDWATTDKADVVDRGDPIPADDADPPAILAEFAATDDHDDRRRQLDNAFDDNALRSLIDAKGLDVDGTDRESMLDALADAGASVQ